MRNKLHRDTAALGRRSRFPLFALIVLLSLVACSDGSDNRNAQALPSVEPFHELFEQGITRYLGRYTPMLSEQDGDAITHSFGVGDGPLCMEGEPFAMATRDQGSDELLIFLEEGGACWPDFCFAATTAVPQIPAEGILDPARDNNPVKSWNQVYIPYCDGSLHAGDRDVDSDGDDQVDRFHRGLHNFSAALDVAARHFPAPSRILLAGYSGGGLGTIFALPMVRYVYPDAKIDLINDSGVGVLRPDDPEFLQEVLEYWNMGAFIPASCDDCIPVDGHLTEYLIWQRDQDQTVRSGMLSYSRDFSLADVFLQIGKPAYEKALFEEMAQLESAHPARTHSWIPAGEEHTFILRRPDQTAGGVPLMDWIGYMLSGSEQWQSAQDNIMEPPPG